MFGYVSYTIKNCKNKMRIATVITILFINFVFLYTTIIPMNIKTKKDNI